MYDDDTNDVRPGYGCGVGKFNFPVDSSGSEQGYKYIHTFIYTYINTILYIK